VLEPTSSAGSIRDNVAIAASVLTAAVLGAVVIMRGFGELDAVHQGWDASFHANAIRFIIDTGDAAPNALRAINNYEDASFFYPNAQHGLTAIVGQLSGASVPSLLNTQLLLLPGIAGLGLAVLVRMFGGRVALAASVPLVLASFSAFPYDLLSRGPLLPYGTGVAMVPAFVVLLDQTLMRRRAPVVVVTAMSAAGLLAVHPGTAVTAAIFAGALLVHRWRRAQPEVKRAEVGTLAGIAGVSVLAGLPFLLGVLAVGEAGAAVNWAARGSLWEAVYRLVLVNHSRNGPQFLLVALIVIGVVRLRGIRRLWWWLAGSGFFAVFFLAVSATEAPITEALSQPWWNDRWRFLALVIQAMAVLAAHGAVTVGDAVVNLGKRRRATEASTTGDSSRAVAGAVLAAFGALTAWIYMPVNEATISANYLGGPSVTPAEQSAMRVLADIAGPEGRVMNDPGDGSAWMYALEGVQPIFGHVVDPVTFQSIGKDQQLLLTAFHCLDSSPRIRELVDKYDIRYVFTGKGYLRDHFSRIPGLQNLLMVDSLELLYAQDGTAIFRVRLGELAPRSSGGLGCADAFGPTTQPLIAWI